VGLIRGTRRRKISMATSPPRLIERFHRRPDGALPRITQLGTGEIGGKAAGLAFLRDEVVAALEPQRHPGIEIDIPRLTILGSDVFEAFVAQNGLRIEDIEGRSDVWIAHRFQRATMPATVVGDLHAFVRRLHIPLAVRSSSRLEDALDHPFAGVYGTKMLPNHQHDPATRFRRLIQAIKFVYGSTWSQAARDYHASLPDATPPESMAVVLQDVVGCRHRDRFYPDVSGVIRSWSAYPLPGCRPEDGVVDLAVGLGRQIVDGGKCWSYCPRRPEATAPFASVADRAQLVQTSFWGVHMGTPPAPDPTKETEYLREFELARAEEDGRLDRFVSSWDRANDRLRPGLLGARGMPRIADFGPLTRYPSVPFNEALADLTELAVERSGSPVEIEFAATLPVQPEAPLRISVLQVRPMAVGGGDTDIDPELLEDERMVVRSTAVLGDGVEQLRDVVFVEPEGFDRAHTAAVAAELAELNSVLVREQRPYALIGFGRWGSSDPWLGIPVRWGQISGVRLLVEAALDELHADPSQGSHFFHNLVGRGVMLMNVPRRDPGAIAWDYLRGLEEVRRTRWCRHVRSAEPLRVLVDGRKGLGVVLHDDR
jgi:hypothetical protein